MAEGDPVNEVPGVTPTCGVLLFNGDSVLLVRHNEGAGHLTGTYGIPSGRYEEDRDGKVENGGERNAALREFEEETGIQGLDVAMLLDFPENSVWADIQRKDGMRRFTLKVYLCTTPPANLNTTPSEETTPEWVPLTRLTELQEQGILLPNVKTLVERADTYRKTLQV